jgi:flavin-binding protein dodecin
MKKQDHIYKIIEIAGSSETSIDDAIQRAVARAAQTLKHIENGKVHHYQVTVKVGFTLEDSDPDEPPHSQ